MIVLVVVVVGVLCRTIGEIVPSIRLRIYALGGVSCQAYVFGFMPWGGVSFGPPGVPEHPQDVSLSSSAHPGRPPGSV